MNVSVPLENFSDQEIDTAIYYGDSNVNIGDSFKITCIIPISEPINWIKDGEPITNHNLRHWRDSHSFITSESPIDGERHKIEAHLSVRHALKAHQGRYQCNNRHSSYHMLIVHKTETTLFTKPQLIDSSDDEEIYFSTQLPDMYLPSVGNTVHHSILPSHTSTPTSHKYDLPLPPPRKIANIYTNATHYNNMYTLPDEIPPPRPPPPSLSERGFTTTTTTTSGRDEHIKVFDRNNITGILLVHPSSFPVSPEYIQMITGRMVEQSTATEPITTRQYYLPVVTPGSQPSSPSSSSSSSSSSTYNIPSSTYVPTFATTASNVMPKPFLRKGEILKKRKF